MTFTKQQEPATGKRKAAEEEPTPSKKVIIQPHFIENRGPYPYNQPKKYVLYTLIIVWNNEHTESVALFCWFKMSVIQVYLLYYSKVYSSDGLLWKRFVIIPHEDQVIQSI